MALKSGWRKRSKNVAFDAFSCAMVSISSEGGPAKWLKINNLSNHRGDFEPGGRGGSTTWPSGQVDRP